MTQTGFSPNGHKRAVLYARVSTDEQAGNYSLSTQLEACRKYAEQQGFVVVGEFSDDYSGATPIEARPEGRKAFAMLKSSEADCLVAYAMDRIARPPEDGDEWDIPVLIRGLAKLGKEIHTVDRGQLKTDFASLLLAVMDGRGAGEERRKIIERTSRGRNGKAQGKRVVGNGYAPYGYRFVTESVKNPKTGLWREVKTGLEELPAEAEVVKLIYKWYTLGDDDDGPLSANRIARRLSENGVPSPGATRNGKRSRAATMWNFGTVIRILQNETYAGVWHFGKQIGATPKRKEGDKPKQERAKKGEGKRKLRPIEEQIAVPVPAIIDGKTWTMALARLAHNREESRYNQATHEYLLRGRIKCVCGRCMSGSATEGIRYYRCNWERARREGVKDIPCKAHTVNANVIEAGVWDVFYNAMTGDPEQFERDLLEAQALEEKQAQPKTDELKTVLDYLAETEGEADEIAQALRKSKGAVAASLERQQDECNKKYDALSRRRDQLQAELAQRILTAEAVDSTLQFRADVAAGLREPTNDDVRFYYRQLNVRVTVDGDLVTVMYDVPAGTVKTFSLNDYRIPANTSRPTPTPHLPSTRRRVWASR